MAEFTTKTTRSGAGSFGVLVIAGIIVLGIAYLVATAGGPAENAVPVPADAAPADPLPAVPGAE